MIIVAGIVAGFLVSIGLVWRSSDATFGTTAMNGSNSWTAGRVSLSNETASVMFNVGGLDPGDAGQRCLAVTYTGNLAASVKLYASASSGTLRQYLNVTVELDDAGGYSNCSGFVAESTPYTGTLLDFSTTKTAFASGVGVWTPTGSGQTRVYRVSYVLDPTTPDSAEGAAAAVTLTWEAQNT